MLFHSRHATWHALQPMHFETSMSFDTGVSCFTGGEIFDADRLTRSSSPNATFTFVVGAGGRTYSKLAIVPSLPYATGPEMGSISTRNALYSGVCALASPTGGVNELIGEAFLASPMKPKFKGMPI